MIKTIVRRKVIRFHSTGKICDKPTTIYPTPKEAQNLLELE